MKIFGLTISLIFSALFFSGFTSLPSNFSGVITGQITYDGNVPKMKTKSVEGCGTVSDQSLLVSRNGGVANVFVHITANIPVAKPRNTRSARIEVNGCQMSPRVLGVMVGQPVSFKNSDGILHNVHGLPKVNKSFNIGMPPTVTKRSPSFAQPEGPFKVKCDVHPWMSGYVAVMTHPYFAVTDRSGRFSIDNLPDGTYSIEAWHEKLGTRRGTAVVKNGQARVNLKF